MKKPNRNADLLMIYILLRFDSERRTTFQRYAAYLLGNVFFGPERL